MEIIRKLTDLIGKHRYAVLVLVIGIILMLLPTGVQEDSEPEATAGIQESVDIATQLEQILSGIQGVGKVKVMLTVETGEVTVYQYDEDGTVIVTDGDRAQTGLVERVESASYRGAIIVCQGADRPTVRLDIIQAVSSVTGLSSDRITVLKMK